MHYSFLLIKTFLDLRLIMFSMADYNCRRNDNQHVQRQPIYMDYCVLYDSENLDLHMESIKTEKNTKFRCQTSRMSMNVVVNTNRLATKITQSAYLFANNDLLAQMCYKCNTIYFPTHSIPFA